MSTITKKELVDRIADSTQAKQALAKAAVQQFLDEIISEVAKGNRLESRDPGVFEVREQAARMAQNPQTPEPIEVPAQRRGKVKTGRMIKEKLSSKIAQP